MISLELSLLHVHLFGLEIQSQTEFEMVKRIHKQATQNEKMCDELSLVFLLIQWINPIALKGRRGVYSTNISGFLDFTNMVTPKKSKLCMNIND